MTKQHMTAEQVEQENQALEHVGRRLFDAKATLRIVNPRGLRLLARNARYFKKDVFQQLTSNVAGDGMLSSVPLCREIEDGSLEVLSGNHRVKASVEAGLAWIMVMVLLGELDEDRRLSIQLSHNALVGVDDPQILAELFGRISDIKAKLYAGLDSAVLKEIAPVKLVTFSTPTVATRTVTFAFTPAEVAKVDDVLRELKASASADVVYLASLEQFEAFFEALQKVKKSEKVKNASLAMVKLVDLVKLALDSGLTGRN